MDYHLERRLRLNSEPEYKNLYSWAINELDTNGQQIGSDLVPWGWTLEFKATSCVLGDSITVKSQKRVGKTELATSEIEQRQVIRVQLRPSSRQNYSRETTFSMFGTDRAIKSFQLDIHPVTEADEQESCKAWGSVSYTTEVDFRDHTTEDCVVFYLFVKPATFARYATKISYGAVDEVMLRVGLVAGFYSEWSPSISTDDVKVLTTGDEHDVKMPPRVQFEPPRLGNVGSAELYINRVLEFRKRTTDPDADDATTVAGTTLVAPEARAAQSVVDAQTLPLLRSLKRAAWFVVVLLSLILITMLSRG